ncbi:methyl-accepting chemotaxis protein [Paenibacillus sp. Dod16]|uniref:methyl-accepting chemotaxis protein n=1 Tax=Paenibacillus sp. Dod16 TaxID=3416392 RepID=UPI003CEF4D63
MKKKSANRIRRNLILTFLFVLLVPSCAIGFITYRDAKGTIEDEILRSASLSVDTANEIINHTLQSKFDDLNYLSITMKSAEIDKELKVQAGSTIHALKQYLGLHPDTVDVFISTAQAGIIKASSEKLPPGYDPRQTGWYQEAMNASGQPIITAPYASNAGSLIVVTIAQMLPDGKGVVGIDLNLGSIQSLVEVQVGKEGYTMVLDQNHKYLFHPDYEAGTDALAEETWISKMYEQPTGHFHYVHDGMEKQLNYITNERTGWKIAGTMYVQEVDDAVNGIRHTMIVVMTVSLLTALILVTWNVSSVIKPIRRMRQATEVISGGDLTLRMKGFKRDEIGELADHFQQMVESLRDMVHGVKAMTENVSASSEELSASALQNTSAVEHVTSSIQEVAAGSERQLNAAEEILKRILQVSRHADEIAEVLEKVTDAMNQTEELAQEGNKTVITAAATMQDIDHAMNDLNGVIHQLSERTEEIGGIASAITDIAKETSLLSLNASIEAARAGEQGKGFAVVAAEIRKLAQRSESSADYISGLIAGILAEMERTMEVTEAARQKVSDGVDAADLTGRSFSRIKKAVNTVSGQVRTTSKAAKELAQDTASTKKSVEDIRGVSEQTSSQTQTISAASEEQLASMEEVSASAADLSRLAEELQEMVKRFKI